MPQQIPFIDVEFIDNSEPRCPCVLLLDTSSSMNGQAITELNAGIEQFARELNEDNLAKLRVEVAIVSFGRTVETVQDFTGAMTFVPPKLSADGATPMGEAVVHAVALLEARKQRLRAGGINPFRPWIFLITDGAPTDADTHFWQKALDLIQKGEAENKLSFFAVAVGGADMSKLTELCPNKRPPMKLKGLSFRELFIWLSSSLKKVSSSNPGTTSLALPAPSGWASIDI